MRKRDNRGNKPAHERNSDSRTSRRYRLQPDEVELLEDYRRVRDEAEAQGIDPRTVKSGWIKSEESSLYFKNPNYQPPEVIKLENLCTDIIEEVQKFAPNYPKIKRKKVKDGHLLVVDPADIHIGKLSSSFETGVEYNQPIVTGKLGANF